MKTSTSGAYSSTTTSHNVPHGFALILELAWAGRRGMLWSWAHGLHGLHGSGGRPRTDKECCINTLMTNEFLWSSSSTLAELRYTGSFCCTRPPRNRLCCFYFFVFLPCTLAAYALHFGSCGKGPTRMGRQVTRVHV